MIITKSKLFKIIFMSILSIISLGILIFLVIDMFNPVLEAFKTNTIFPLEKRFQEYGVWKYLFIIFFQFIILISTIIPNQFIQFLAGLTCSTIPGLISCTIGILIGNIVIYILFKRKPNSFNDKQKIKLENVQPKSNKEIWMILSLYLVPGVPYGVAAMYAANKKISFFKYIILTTLGSIPITFICTLYGNHAIEPKMLPFTIFFAFISLIGVLISNNRKIICSHLKNRSLRATFLWAIPLCINFILMIIYVITLKINKLLIMIFIFLGYLLLYILFNKFVSKIFEKSRKKYNMPYFQGPVKKNNPFLYFIFYKILKMYFFKKYKVEVKNLPTFDKPSILLFNHPSKFDFLYTFIPIYPNKVHPLVAYYYFCNYRLGRLIKELGAFPKFLYQPDISSMKNIFRVIKSKEILALAPEGRLSAYGAMEKIIPSTAKMVKKIGAQVIIAKINGAYFTAPKWAKTTRSGKVTISYKEVLTPNQIQNLTDLEIYEILKMECDYDDFKWQEENNITYKGKKFAEGLEDILYICPVCKNQFSFTTKNNKLICSCCKTEIILDNKYNFISDNILIPKTIKEWYLFQKEEERKNIEDVNYSLSSNVTLKLPSDDGKGLIEVGKGITTLTHQGVVYKGFIKGEEKEILFKIENLPAILFGVREDFEIYHHNTLYYFVPDDIKVCVKWSVVGEQIYEKFLLDNNLKEWESNV